ncbi:hypothetical protein BH10BAC5_BH10BAC5_26570 [soil metagenome]
MNLFNLVIMQQAPGDIGSILSSLVPFLLIIVIFYFLILRPQQKKAKERTALLAGVKKGDKVITAGGVYATVEGLEDNVALIKIAEGVKIKVDKTSITTILGVTETTPTK